MDKATSPVEKFRQQFYDDIKKEDIEYVNARSKKASVDLYRRKESDDNPWTQCFYLNDNESKNTSEKSSNGSTTGEKDSDSQNVITISNCSSLTDEEINYCKAALRREAFSRHLPDLSSKPDELRLLFLDYREEFPKNFRKQRLLYGEIVCNRMNFEVYLKDGLKSLKPVRKIRVTEDTTLDKAIVDINKMRRMVQDFKTISELVTQNLRKVIEKFESYQELDEKMDREVFNFLAHFFPKYLVPKFYRKKVNTKLHNLDSLKIN